MVQISEEGKILGVKRSEMTQELTSSKRTPLSGRVRTVAAKASSWQRIALAAILCLSAFLNIFRLTDAGYGNSYYAAAVKDMLTSWHNFFFVSFDAGFVSVDKPPLGLWVQAASAYLFGFSGLSLLLPQAIAGVLSVALLYHLVSRVFGPVAGLVAALALAVTPVAVGVERTNNADGLLTLTVLVAAWAVIRAVESGRLPWLLLGALLVGLGFNMKMLEAYLVLPALYLFYLVASSASWRRRFLHLGAATVVLLVVSLSWAVVVDSTPADQRPYVGSSSNNSALDLAFGYNGLERLLGREGAPGGGQGQSAPENNAQEGPLQGGGFGPGGARENGDPGPLRLLNEQMAGQIGWLLPLAVVGLLAASWQSKRPRLPLDQQNQGLPLWRRWRSRLVSFFKNLPQLSLDRRQGALVLWGMWLVTMAVFFSIAGMFHRYYMVMLAPAVAALVGIGVVALWSDYRRAGWRGWLLPLTLLGMAALHTYMILAHYDEDWTPWLPPAIAGLCLFTVGVLVAGRLLRSRPNNARGSSSAYLAAGAVAVGILALLIAPTAWAFYTVWQGGGGGLAGAGPRPVQEYEYGGPGGPPPGGGPSRGGPGGPDSSNADPMLMNYLQANRDDAKYLVGTINSMSASPIILSTDEPDPVITLGGFMGRDPVLTTDRLANLVDRGAVRFFLMPDRERMEQMRAEYASSSQQGAPPWGGRGFLQNESVSWVEDNCKKIPQEEWQSPEDDEGQGRGGPMGRSQALYDCGT